MTRKQRHTVAIATSVLCMAGGTGVAYACSGDPGASGTTTGTTVRERLGAHRAAFPRHVAPAGASAGEGHPQPRSQREQEIRFELADRRGAAAVHGQRELAPRLGDRRDPRRRPPADGSTQLIGSAGRVVARQLAERAVGPPNEHLLLQHPTQLGAGTSHSVAAATAACP